MHLCNTGELFTKTKKKNTELKKKKDIPDIIIEIN